MSNSRIKKIILLLLGTVSIMVVIILAAIWIQREIRWKETRKEMDLFENEILQNIVITENERLPSIMIDALYTAIMTADTEVDNQHLPAFESLTEEFLIRINSQMNLSLNPEDLNSHVVKKSDIEKYGDEHDITMVSYEFVIGEETFVYDFYKSSKMIKVISMGTTRVNRVLIGNENNESISAVYSEWKSRYDAYGSTIISLDVYNKFMRSRNIGIFPKDELITLEKIRSIN